MSSSHLLAGLPCFRYSLCLVGVVGFQLVTSFVQRPSLCLGIILVGFQYILPKDPRRDSVCCQQIIGFARYLHNVVHPRFQLVSWIVVWNFVHGGVVVWVVTAFFFLDGVKKVGFRRVALLSKVVGLAVGGIVDARGVRNCGTPACVSDCLYDRPHRPSFRRVEFLLRLFRHLPRVCSV